MVLAGHTVLPVRMSDGPSTSDVRRPHELLSGLRGGVKEDPSVVRWTPDLRQVTKRESCSYKST